MQSQLNDMLKQAFAEATKLYQERGFQRRVGFGKKPALIKSCLPQRRRCGCGR